MNILAALRRGEQKAGASSFEIGAAIYAGCLFNMSWMSRTAFRISCSS
jgi:hypothetical protein